MQTKLVATLFILIFCVSSHAARMIVKYKSGFSAPSLEKTANFQVVETSKSVDEIESNPAVEYAEEDKVYRASVVLNDPYFQGRATNGMWGLSKIKAPSAWNFSAGFGVVVAVVDSGVDETHPDLQGATVQGWNFANANPFPVDQFGHGTHIAGIIAARSNNGIGIVGVAPESKVMPIKVLDQNGMGFASNVALGIRYAADNGAKIVNCSFGGPYTQVVAEAVAYAISRGLTVVAASGNESTNDYNLCPAALPNVITVAASNPSDMRCAFSNWGKVDITAPGFEILSLRATGTDMAHEPNRIVDGMYYQASGTSMATPFVSAVAALILSRNPGLSPDNVKRAIQNSADDIGVKGTDNLTGFGRINAVKSDPSVDKKLNAGETYAYPNPVRPGQALTLHGEIGVAEKVKVSVYTVVGELIESKDIDGSCLKVINNKYSYESIFDYSSLASGVYIFTVSGTKDGERVVGKGKFAVIR